MLRTAFIGLALLCLSPLVSSSFALFLGISFALFLSNPYLTTTQKLAPRLMQISLVGLGAGMNLLVVAKVGAQGILSTAIGIFATMVVGALLGRVLKVSPTLSFLLSGGTAICGGSAIAALSSTLRAHPAETSVSLGVVFSLNALALVVFPPLGHFFALSGEQFGYWSGMAIHDTTSVVGAALSFGADAVATATTVKLARALWIVPLAFTVGMIMSGTHGDATEEQDRKKPAKPWFILWFVVVAAVVTWLPFLAEPGKLVYTLAQRSLVVTLFLVGANLSRSSLLHVGYKPLLQGVLLWFLVAGATLLVIRNGLIIS